MWLHAPGEMPEWSIGAVSKTVVRVTGPRVRIPISPQHMNDPAKAGLFVFMMALRKFAFESD